MWPGIGLCLQSELVWGAPQVTLAFSLLLPCFLLATLSRVFLSCFLSHSLVLKILSHLSSRFFLFFIFYVAKDNLELRFVCFALRFILLV